MSQYFGQTLFRDISSIFLHVPNLSNNARTIKKKKKPCCCIPCHSHLLKNQRHSPDRDGSMCLFVSLTEDFRYNSLPVYPLFFSSGDGGGLVCFTVINTCTQSFNLPYLSHVTVWLHCLIWVSFNLSRPRLEINEGRKRHTWVCRGAEGYKESAELETSVAHLTVLFLFLVFSALPCSPFSVSLHLSPSLYFSLSLFSCLAARCSPFFALLPPPPNRRSARGPFGVRHLCSVIQSATALFIPDLFGALESLSLICAKILYFFFLFFHDSSSASVIF